MTAQTVHGEVDLRFRPLRDAFAGLFASGRTPGAYVRDELAAPWGLDLAFGATAGEQRRTATL